MVRSKLVLSVEPYLSSSSSILSTTRFRLRVLMRFVFPFVLFCRQAPGLKSGGGRRGWHSRCLTRISGRASSLQSVRALWVDDVRAFRSRRNGPPCVTPLCSLVWGALALKVVAPKPLKANCLLWTPDVAAQDPGGLAKEKKEKRCTRNNWH